MRKRSWVVRITVLLAMLALTAACGGGGGGGGTPPPTPLATGTFTKTIAPDLSNTPQSGPFNTGAYRRAMHIYQASDIDGAGYVKSVSFRLDSNLATAVSCPNTSVRLGHTSKAEFDGVDNTFAGYVEEGKGSFVTMIDNTTVSIPTGSIGDYYALNFTTPFYYNGVDNLVVDVERTTACDGTVGNNLEQTVGYRGQLYSSSSPTTGIEYTGYQQIRLSFSGGDDKVEFGGSESNTFPFNISGKHVQLLYLSSEIDGSGPITGVGFQVNALTTGATYTYTVKLGHTTVSALTATFADNFNAGSPATVANTAAFTVPANVPAGEYIWIPLSGSFTYNGTDNLIVEVDVLPGGAVNNSLRTITVGSAGKRAYGNSGGVTATGVDDRAYHAKFRFNGGTMDVLTPGGMAGGSASSFPFYNMDGKFQFLYVASELGTKGTISKFMCRNWADASAETGNAYTMVMSHTSATTLGTTFASNLISPVTVYSGSFDVPVKKKGDWIEIPLSTPFAYNGKDNLVTQVSGSGGSAGGLACIMDLSMPTYYVGRVNFSTSSAAATGGVSDRVIDGRFVIAP